MRRGKLGEMLKFSKPKGPGFGIEQSFYLSVMAARMPLPSIREVVAPKGEDGAVAGFGVPMKGEKDDLDRPMERGVYAIASLDRKTLIRCLVVSKEEAGFDPTAFLRSPRSTGLSNEARSRMASTWMLIQLSFESYDPQVHPAVCLMTQVADRLAMLTGGLVADPLSEVYRLPGEWSLAAGPEEFAVQDSVSVHRHEDGPGFSLNTLGMRKYGLPEFEIFGVEERFCLAAERLLLGLCKGVLSGKPVSPGDSVGSRRSAFRIAEGGLNRAKWEGIPVLEAIPEQVEDVNSVLARWELENG